VKSFFVLRDRRPLSRRRLAAFAAFLAVAAFARDVAAQEALPPAAVARDAQAQEALPPAAEVVRNVNAREQGRSMSQRMAVALIDRDGSRRERGMVVFRRRTEDEAQTVMFFTSPASIDGTGLLVRDYDEAGRDDGLWLYLPAMRSVRRIAGGGRGEEFFGTDFTLFEVSTDTRLRDDLLTFEVTAAETIEGAACIRLLARPSSEKLARELGYGHADYWIDRAAWVPRRIDLRDTAGKLLKEVRFDDIRQVAGIWTVHRRSARDAGDGRRTIFETTDVRYDVDVPASLFTESGLSHGPPRR